ncbi:MAG: AAA family ATPase [Candidatus Omnitrophica bacterium]|nr:AAA family ATPase [Candidatus Omnitrophota bacterium]
MSYYKILGLEKEPFSTSPDPEFFYLSQEHKSAFYRLRAAVSLKRGLNLILGDVGVGKTTLMRKLFNIFSEDAGFITKITLDPTAKSEYAFLSALGDIFQLKPGFRSSSNYKKAMENFLFEKGVKENNTIVLFIDEAQKLSPASMEVLRLLLNYETNVSKLIQIVLFAQMELLPEISRINNLWDRVALKCVINPLKEEEVREMIDFRLNRAGRIAKEPLFSDNALNAIYNYTQGYPRKITMFCHEALQYLVMHKKGTVDKEVVQEMIQKEVRIVTRDASRIVQVAQYV